MFKKLFGFLAVVFVFVGLFLAFGPREPIDETISFDEKSLPADLDAYISESEAKVAGIIPGAEKQILWADPNTKSKTPISLIYLHGFSATLEETRPMPDLIAEGLGANLYFARLSGHGRGGDALAEPTVNDWFNDTAEAIAIARAIGDKVVILSASTGSTFAAWAATKPELMKDVSGIVMVSPNFALNNPAAPILTLGGARTWIPPLFGAERSFEAYSEDHKKWWTSTYPTVAVLPMAAAAKLAKGLDYEKVKTPALFIYHPDDKVVRADISEGIAKRWGTQGGTSAKIIEVLEAEDKYNHVIAGRILSPSNTKPLADKSLNWIKGL